jgi:hypothetical protein
VSIEEPRCVTREEGLCEAARRMEIHSAFSGLGVGEEHGVPEETE